MEDSNGVNGNSSSNGGYVDHGWQKVTNLKKQKRQESKGKVGKEVEKPVSKDSKLFQALEEEAEERRARRDARIQAALAGDAPSEEDSDADNEKPVQEEETEVKKPKTKKPKKPKVTVAEAAAAIDVSDLSTFLSDISESFQDANLQLLRCADFFGRAFSGVTTASFQWNKLLRETPLVKQLEIPLCYVPEAVNKTLADWLSGRPAEALSKFILWILKEVLEDVHAHAGSHKNSKTNAPSQRTKVGVIILLAIIVRKKPDVLQYQASSVRSQFQALDQLPTLVWAYGQAAQGDLVVGMQLWVQNLLPLAVGKSSTPALRDTTLQFIESVLFANLKKARPILLNGVTRKGERLVPAASFDLVLRASFPAESSRTKASERFQALYPLIKELALGGSHNSKSTRPVAQQLLPLSLAAISEDNEALSQEARSNFIWCLAQNTDCFAQWEKLHLENLKASNRVLGYIRQNWKEVSLRFSQLPVLKKTLQNFRSKQKRALETAQDDRDFEFQLKTANGHCKVLLSKLSSVSSCVSGALTIAAAVAMGYGFFLLSPERNPWKWDGWLLLSNTHFEGFSLYKGPSSS